MTSTAAKPSVQGKPFTFPLNHGLSVRVYEDTRPCCLETASIQKGLVLLLNGVELIEEGVGFGVPIVKYEDKTFFSSKAQVTAEPQGDCCMIQKIFSLDTVSLKKLGDAAYIDDAFYSPLRRTFAGLYLKHKRLNAVFNKAMELRQLAQIKTEFLTVKPRGAVAVTYHCTPTAIEVKVDLSRVALDRCREVLVLNEQGAGTFQRYLDTGGLRLEGRRIGAWDNVETPQATLCSPSGKTAFTLQNRRGAALFRGWEHTRNRFSWAGLSYSMQPRRGLFEYAINLKSP